MAPTRSVGGVATVLLGALTRWMAHGPVHWVSADGEREVAPLASGRDQPWTRDSLKSAGHSFRTKDWPNQWIWPLWHGLPPESSGVANARASLQAYQEDSEAVAEWLLKTWGGAAAWLIQDYQWAFLPRALRRASRRTRRPLPPLSLFWYLPWPHPLNAPQFLLQEVVRGLLGADFLGFQSEAALEGFCQSVAQVLGESGVRRGPRNLPWGVEVTADGESSRVVQLGVCPVSCYRSSFGGDPPPVVAAGALAPSRRKIVLGVDRVDPSKGLLDRIAAFEGFLEQNPFWRTRVTWWEFASPSRLALQSYREHLQEVRSAVRRVQQRWGSAVLRFWLKEHRPERLQWVYPYADVVWATSVADGMNLVGSEYVLARGVRPGELILTESMGAAAYLRAATRVPVGRPKVWAEALRECLERNGEARAADRWQLRREVRARSAEDWGEELLLRTLAASDFKGSEGLSIRSPR